MVDLAVPRDIEPEVGELDDVFLYTIDDLAQVVAVGVESRQAAAAQAEAIIETQVEQFTHWLAARDTVPLIRSLRDTFERARRHELEHAMKRLAAGDTAEKALLQLSQRLTNKFLHSPVQALQQAGEKDRHALRQAAERLLRIREQESGFGSQNET
jgi:glutamyl-tRNA reductase